jgi:hypothetical protein
MRDKQLLSTLLLALFLAWPAAGEASAAIATHFCLALGTPAVLPHPASVARRDSYVVLQSWEARRAGELKALNPDLEVLVYQNLSAMAEGTGRGGMSSSGVNFGEADVTHPEWFLREADGSRIAERGWPWLWMADIGLQGYQRRWTANVLRLLRSGPWDGVLMDDTNTTARFHVPEISRIAKYPSDPAYQQAVGSMLAYAGPRIIAAGKLAIPNVGSWPDYPAVVANWLGYVSGGMDEMFAKWSPVPGKGYSGPNLWLTQLREVQSTERMGKLFLAVTHAPAGDRGVIRYGWASALLGAGGHTSYYAAGPRFGESWSPSYEVALGRPRTEAWESADGIWRRGFAHGLVVVNPTLSPAMIRLHGLYSGSGLDRARTARMGPHSGLILTRVRP